MNLIELVYGSRIMREVARHISMLGASVIILPVSTNALSRRFPRAPVARNRLGFEHDEWLSRYSVEIVRVAQNPLHLQLDGLSVRNAVARLLRGRHIDIVLSHYHEGAFLPSFLRSRAIRFGFLAIWQTYAGFGQPLPLLKGLPSRWIKDRFVNRPHLQADILFAISRFTRQELIEVVGVNPNRIVLCPLGVDPGLGRISRPVPRKVDRFLFFGRIIPSKGFLDAIEALALVAARGNRDWKYRIVGEGRHEWAREAAHERGIGDLVEVVGATDDVGLASELGRAHLAIMPSHAESFGLSIAEAQAAGVPVVSYDVTAVPEVVENGVTGWLAPFPDIGRLAAAIEDAVADPESTHLRGLKGRERALERFSWDRTAATILEATREIL